MITVVACAARFTAATHMNIAVANHAAVTRLRYLIGLSNCGSSSSETKSLTRQRYHKERGPWIGKRGGLRRKPDCQEKRTRTGRAENQTAKRNADGRGNCRDGRGCFGKADTRSSRAPSEGSAF